MRSYEQVLLCPILVLGVNIYIDAGDEAMSVSQKEDIVPRPIPRVVHTLLGNPAVPWERFSIAALGLVVAMLVSGCVEPYPIWKKLDEAPFPVKVNALVTEHRNVLSKQKMLTYEGWRVGFGSEIPTATANANCSWQVRCDVHIKYLRCETGSGGQEDCSLHLDTLDEACELLVERSGEKVGIACPVDIVLDGAEEKLSALRARY
jgi:hypothetical protein